MSRMLPMMLEGGSDGIGGALSRIIARLSMVRLT